MPKPLRSILTAGLPALALWWWSRSGLGVEALYAGHIYPLIGGALQGLTGALPFSLFEVLVLAGAPLLLLSGLAAVRRRRALAWLGRALTLAAWILTWFLAAWGVNYGRDTLKVQQGWGGDAATSGPIGEGEIRALASRLALATAAAWRALPPAIAGDTGSRLPWDRSELAGIIDRGYRRLDWLAYAPARDWVSPRPKPVQILFFPFPASGMFSPWTSEAQYDAGLPDASLPFTAAHELAHARGYAREDEANLLGFAAGLACGDDYVRYGVLRAGFSYVNKALRSFDKAAAQDLRALLPEGVRADWRAISAHWERKPELTLAAGGRTYDAYLRSQGVSEGRRSYSRVVKLLVLLDRSGEMDLDVSTYPREEP